MTPRQKQLVRETFAKVVPISDQAAALFYSRLFEVDPSLRGLFATDMQVQGRKLMQMIGYCVANLDALGELIPAVKELGRKHAGYRVKPADYGSVGAALLWTLEQGLGPAFTPEVKEAWSDVYQTLASTMLAGAHAAPA
jgi:hemoglobin-like flavoprotein